MTIPKWLLPVLAVVAAIAVGVAATLIGLRFQPQQTVETSAAPITVPVLAPLAPVDNDDPNSGYIWGLGDTRASLDVVPPGAVLPDDLDLEGALDRYAEASDPGAELEAIAAEAEAETDGAAPVGDSCAPTEGEAPEGCPPGVMGTVLALVRPPEFRLVGQAYPPTEAEYAERGNPVGPLWCLPTVGLGENDVQFGILSTVPATFSVLYWPDGRGDARLTVTAPTPDNTDAWEAALADVTDTAELPPLQRCVVLPDLEPNTAYRAMVIGTTPSDIVRLSGTISFNSGGLPVRPAAEFNTLGSNYVFARAMHTVDQRVEFRAYITNSPDDPMEGPFTTCPSGPSSLSAIAGQISDLPESEVLAANAPSDYTKRTAYVFRVPEGANVIFCARWYPGESGLTSWERAVPLWETMTSFSAPDRILPVMTLGAGGPIGDIGSDIQLTVSTTQGVVCGVTDLLVENSVPTDHPELCNPAVLASASARERDRHYWSEEFTGDLVLTTILTAFLGSIQENTVVIPASRANCFGACELPADQVFGFPVGRPASATLQAVLSWTQGYTNGNTGWTQAEVVDGAVSELDTDPKMNTDERFRFTTIDPVKLTGSATLRLETDRPVTYRVSIRNPNGTVACQISPSGPAPWIASGSSSGETTITFNDLCRARLYTAEVTLTDPVTGATSFWTSTSLPHRWPGGRSFFGIPGQRFENLNYSWEVTTTNPELDWTAATFTAGGVTDEFANSGELCVTESDPMRGAGVVDTIVGSTSTFELSFYAARLSEYCEIQRNYAYFHQPLEVDLFTLTTTGEQDFTFRPFPETVVHVRVWVP